MSKVFMIFLLIVWGSGYSAENNEAEKFPLYRWHKIVGGTNLMLATGSAISGSMVLEKYKNNERPSDGLLYTHRTLGSLTTVFALTNGYLGFKNYNDFKNIEEGKRKRNLHRIFSSLSILGFATAAILGAAASAQYKDASTPSEVKIADSHRAAALSATGLAITTVLVLQF